ncbi:MAG: hypothetical protein ACRCXD_13775 [Luteolibacter sp.]
MHFRRSILHLLTCVAAALSLSCIDGREEVWIHANGSGRAEAVYSVPAVAAGLHGGKDGVRRMIERFLENAPGITSSSCEVATAGDQLEIRVRTTFDSALELKKFSSGTLPSAAAGLAGKFELAVKGLSIDFARTIHAGDALPGAGLIPVAQIKDRYLTYIFHLPKAATTSNATRTENSGRTLVWEFPLAQAIAGPVTTRFTAPVPLPPWLVFAICAIGALIAVFGSRKLFRAKPPTG